VTVSLFEHTTHPHVRTRRQTGPVTVSDQHLRGTAAQRFNTRLALWTTRVVGTMWCAYAFAALDCLALPQAIKGGMFGVVQWVASFFLQLVLLSIIMVGQNVQATAADKRSELTYLDTEALLSSVDQVTRHLTAQDSHVDQRLDVLVDQVSALAARLDALSASGHPLAAGGQSA